MRATVILWGLALVSSIAVGDGTLYGQSISNSDAFQLSNITINGGTGWINGQHGGSIDGMFGGLGFDPAEPGTAIFVDTVFQPSVLDINRSVSAVNWTMNTPTTLSGVNLFLNVDVRFPTARAVKSFALIADTNGTPGFQSTDDHVFVSTVNYDSVTGLATLSVPFATTASKFLFEAEPYFSVPDNMFLGPRVMELDAVVPEPAGIAVVGLGYLLLLRRRSKISVGRGR